MVWFKDYTVDDDHYLGTLEQQKQKPLCDNLLLVILSVVWFDSSLSRTIKLYVLQNILSRGPSPSSTAPPHMTIPGACPIIANYAFVSLFGGKMTIRQVIE